MPGSMAVVDEESEAEHDEHPRRDQRDLRELVEDVRNQGDAEQRSCGERKLQRDPPQINVALRTELGRARTT